MCALAAATNRCELWQVRDVFFELLGEGYKKPHAVGICQSHLNTPAMQVGL